MRDASADPAAEAEAIGARLAARFAPDRSSGLPDDGGFAERAAILEYDAGLPRASAERFAREMLRLRENDEAGRRDLERRLVAAQAETRGKR